jgi:L-ascorbate metabolism protein UlaG (beta-lactamase superfamily)
MAPIDGGWTMTQADMETVIEQLHPPIVIPMHYMYGDVLERFIGHVKDKYPVRRKPTSSVILTRAGLPSAGTEIWVLQGH